MWHSISRSWLGSCMWVKLHPGIGREEPPPGLEPVFYRAAWLVGVHGLIE